MALGRDPRAPPARAASRSLPFDLPQRPLFVAGPRLFGQPGAIIGRHLAALFRWNIVLDGLFGLSKNGYGCAPCAL